MAGTVRQTVHLSARSPRERSADDWRMIVSAPWMKDNPPGPPAPSNEVEIIEVTTVEHVRSDGTRMPNTSREVTEQVLMRLHVDRVPGLVRALTEAALAAIDTRTYEQQHEPIPEKENA